LIGGYNLNNVYIYEGTIDGNGQYWWDLRANHTIKHARPRLVELERCTNVMIFSVKLHNSAFWTLHPIYCDQVVISNVEIINPWNSKNTDGIDPDSSTNVLIDSCYISVGDDNIAIKSGMDMAGILYNRPSANITISNLVCEYGDGISIGSEMSGGVHNVTFVNISMTRTSRAIYIKSGMGRGGLVNNIHYQNVTVWEIGKTSIEIDLLAYGQHPENKTTTPHVRDVFIKGVLVMQLLRLEFFVGYLTHH